MSKAVKIGLLGGQGGHPRDIQKGTKPSRLVNVHVYSDGSVINALKFTYKDEDGKQHTVGPWGATGDLTPAAVVLDDGENLKEISGTYGEHGQVEECITSLKFVTSEKKNKKYEYGEATGTAFKIPVAEDGKIVAFFGRAAEFIDALGVYAIP